MTTEIVRYDDAKDMRNFVKVSGFVLGALDTAERAMKAGDRETMSWAYCFAREQMPITEALFRTCCTNKLTGQYNHEPLNVFPDIFADLIELVNSHFDVSYKGILEMFGRPQGAAA